MTERKGEKSKHLKVFENCFAHLLETAVAQKAAAECGGNGRKSADLPRPNQPGRLERIVVTTRHENVAGTWLSVLNHFPSSDPASLDQGSHWKPDAPASMFGEKHRTLGSRVWHTHTHKQLLSRTICVCYWTAGRRLELCVIVLLTCPNHSLRS